MAKNISATLQHNPPPSELQAQAPGTRMSNKTGSKEAKQGRGVFPSAAPTRHSWECQSSKKAEKSWGNHRTQAPYMYLDEELFFWPHFHLHFCHSLTQQLATKH